MTEPFGQIILQRNITGLPLASVTQQIGKRMNPDGAPASSEETGRDGGKLRQILDGARRVFLTDGFDGASMNDIAREAGVSKGTLYVYFDSKEALFVALIRADRKQQAEQLCDFVGDEDEPVDVVLRRFGTSLLTHMTSPDSLAHIRTVIAIAGKIPEIGRAFYEAGPAYGEKNLGAWLAQRTARGEVAIDDPESAASHYLQLCQGSVFRRMLFGVTEQATEAELAAAVDQAVDLFMRAYRKS